MILLGAYLARNNSIYYDWNRYFTGVTLGILGVVIFIVFLLTFLLIIYSNGGIQAKVMMKESLTREERMEIRKEIIEMKCHPTWYFGTGASKLELIEIDD